MDMVYTVKDYSKLQGMPGFSMALLNNHFSLYQGYVNNTNKLMDKLAAMLAADGMAVPEYAELKRRLGWEFNGMRLHELYFENLGGAGRPDMGGELALSIREAFGSFEAWEKDFRACAAMRGIGWVILYYDGRDERLFNQWINEHDGGHPAGCTPILVLDVFEHAFMLDYGLKRVAYVDAFFAAIDWQAAAQRLLPARVQGEPGAAKS
jgi:Fe-Mn family superoxide dismutase